ncbi:DUF1819 family protein [Candidatus Desantisbacteria bacterium]|nr:DUF1819 family protein [Candidatus Desantisbacteria bacterium]
MVIAGLSKKVQKPLSRHSRKSEKKYMEKLYKANITAGALLVPESRKIANLMICNVSPQEWKDAIEQKNILQKLSVSSSKRVASHIRSRLELMTPELWQMVRDGDAVLSTQAVFAAAIKHCRILGDYLDLVVREQFRRLEDKLTPALWDEFILSLDLDDGVKVNYGKFGELLADVKKITGTKEEKDESTD